MEASPCISSSERPSQTAYRFLQLLYKCGDQEDRSNKRKSLQRCRSSFLCEIFECVRRQTRY